MARLKESHHRIARLFAMGLRTGEVATATGYSVTRVSILKQDPAFKELVAGYMAAVDQDWREEAAGYYENIAKSRDITARMILDKLVEADSEDGEEIPLRTLTTLHGDLADRTGYGKRSTITNINLDFASQLDRAIKRSETKTIEHQPGLPGPVVEDAPALPPSEATPQPLLKRRA